MKENLCSLVEGGSVVAVDRFCNMSAEEPCLQESACVKCRDCNGTDTLIELTGKGLDTLFHLSDLRKDAELISA